MSRRLESENQTLKTLVGELQTALKDLIDDVGSGDVLEHYCQDDCSTCEIWVRAIRLIGKAMSKPKKTKK